MPQGEGTARKALVRACVKVYTGTVVPLVTDITCNPVYSL